MRGTPNPKVEPYRVDGPPGTNYGFFALLYKGMRLRIQASAGGGWDHVSVSLSSRCPTWEEMAFVKGLFFHEDEVAMELHVARRNHLSLHPYTLHLWRPQTDAEIAAERERYAADGELWPYGDLPSPGTIPLPPLEFVAPPSMAGAAQPE